MGHLCYDAGMNSGALDDMEQLIALIREHERLLVERETLQTELERKVFISQVMNAKRGVEIEQLRSRLAVLDVEIDTTADQIADLRGDGDG